MANMTARTSLFRRIGKDPHVDWAIIFTVAFILAVGLALLGAGTYAGVGDSMASAVSTATSSSAYSIDTQALNRVLGAYDSQQGLRTDLLRGYAGPGDPSL